MRILLSGEKNFFDPGSPRMRLVSKLSPRKSRSIADPGSPSDSAIVAGAEAGDAARTARGRLKIPKTNRETNRLMPATYTRPLVPRGKPLSVLHERYTF